MGICVHRMDNATQHYVKCDGCGAEGTKQLNRDRAVNAAWNAKFVPLGGKGEWFCDRCRYERLPENLKALATEWRKQYYPNDTPTKKVGRSKVRVSA